MAMSDEELLQQMNILTSKTGSNPLMVYKPLASLNKGLDPSLFTGSDTKIVNAINILAKKVNDTIVKSDDTLNKVNEVLMDTADYTKNQIWEELKTLMGKDTIIEGLKNILDGNVQQQVLGITADDIGKVLSVVQDENGNLKTQAIDISNLGGGGIVEEIAANKVTYTNENKEEITTVEGALDYLFTNMNSGSVIDSITWDKIQNPPEIAKGIELSSDALILKSESGEMSSVPLVSDEDVNGIVDTL